MGKKKGISKLASLFILAIVGVTAVSFGLGMAFNFANEVWHMNVNAREVEKASYNKNEIVVMTYNTRNTSADRFGNRRWGVRLPHILDNIRNINPDIFGVQEVDKRAEKDLNKYLLSSYDTYGKYREKVFGNEMCAIYFRKDRFKLIDKGYFWLSETPDKKSVGWDASMVRICSYVVLEDLDGEQYAVFNTHLDHKGLQSRNEAMKLVLSKMESLKVDSMFLLGDFNNSYSEKSYTETIKVLHDAKYYEKVDKFTDFKRINDYQTYNGWKSKYPIDYKIDHIFFKGDVVPKTYGVVTKTYDGVFPSDHFPVVVVFEK